MSVNEVKLKKVPVEQAFVVKGASGDGTAATFLLGNEDHTLGNVLRHTLICDSQVHFTGYSVPHPAQPIVQIRVQTAASTTATAALKRSCQTVFDQCDHALQKLEELLPEVREDRLRMEALLLEEAGFDDDDDDAMEEVDDVEMEER